MATVVKHSIPFRLGRALGLVVRFCFHDRNPKVRWLKRVVFVWPLLFLLVSNLGWIFSTIFTTVSLVAGMYAFSKVDPDKIDFFGEDGEDVPYGRDVFGRPLDSRGKPF